MSKLGPDLGRGLELGARAWASKLGEGPGGGNMAMGLGELGLDLGRGLGPATGLATLGATKTPGGGCAGAGCGAGA